MSQMDNVSHVEIYHKLGTLEGKMDALIARTSDYRNDLESAFTRIAEIENRQSWMMGGAIVISAIIPLLIHVISSSFHLKVAPNPPEENVALIKRI